MKGNYRRLAALLAALLSVCSLDLQAKDLRPVPPRHSKEIAVTIDDLPLNGPGIGLERLRTMTAGILSGLNKHRIPAVGFVNESLLYAPGETDARIAILKSWSDAGVELANHGFSHLNFKDVSLSEYEDDFVRGETVTKMLLREKGQKIRYFRHPFLQMAPTPETEKAFESFIAQRGYRIAPVTVDPMDWMFLAAYARARKEGDESMLKRVSEEYLKFVGRRLDFSEKTATDLFGRPVKHILLLHANELNADNFDALIRVMTDRGFKFITLEEALTDPIYQFPDKYAATSDWLSHWAFSRGKRFGAPMPPEFIQKAFGGN